MASTKYSIDEIEAIRDLMSHEGFPLLMREIEQAKESIASIVLSFDCGSAERELFRLACNAEGAAKLLTAVKARLSALRQKPDA